VPNTEPEAATDISGSDDRALRNLSASNGDTGARLGEEVGLEAKGDAAAELDALRAGGRWSADVRPEMEAARVSVPEDARAEPVD